jgi:hypothetical protein
MPMKYMSIKTDPFDEKEESFVDYSANFDRDCKDIKRSLRFEQGYDGVHVFVVVSDHEDHEKNKLLEIPAASGDALNYEVHDTVRDVYHIEGIDFFEIGAIPVNYRVAMDDVPWEMDIPLPFSLIKRYMTEEQKAGYEKWKAAYKGSEYSFEYLQVLGVY